MSAKSKLAVVKKSDPEAEFEALLRRTADYLKSRGPQLVRQSAAPRRARLA